MFIFPKCESSNDEYTVPYFEYLSIDSNSPVSIIQSTTKFQLSFIICYGLLKPMLLWPLNPIYTQIPNSTTSITQGPIKFQPSLVTISDFLNRCSFDLKCKQTDRQTNFFHMTLLTVEGITGIWIENILEVHYTYEGTIWDDTFRSDPYCS